MKSAVDYSIAIKQHQQRLFHSLIIAEWQVRQKEDRIYGTKEG